MQNADYQYIEAIKKNDKKLVKELYKQFLPAVIKLVRSNKGNQEEARDIFQEALLIVYEKAQQANFVLTSSFKAYLLGICRYLWLRQLKKKYRSDLTIEGDEGYTIKDDIEILISEEEKWRLLRQKFAQLGKDCQQVLQLFFDGHSLREIAQKMNYTEKTAKWKKFSCKEKLSDLIKKDPRYRELVEF